MGNFSTIEDIRQVSAEAWDALVPGRYPFASHAFLSALEASGCVSDRTGWQPAHRILTDENDRLIAAVPAYVKSHSYGEYVFDWAWAEAYQRYGMAYYPKLLLGIPFTPASGPRLLGEPEHFDSLYSQLASECDQQGFSGWHLNFPVSGEFPVPEATAEALRPGLRSACQFHWFNRGYDSFEHYLSHFVSRKRKSVLKERRQIAEQGVHMVRKTGSDITEDDLRYFYRCYVSTYQQRMSTPYLTLDCFMRIRDSLSEQMLLVQAQRDGKACASALYFFDDETLYGRYWGCTDDISGLHFEACYYQGIEFCIEQGLQRFDPGTQGEHKISRGFEPVLTYSLHWLAHPSFQDAVGRFIAEETPHIEAYRDDAQSLLPFHRESTG